MLPHFPRWRQKSLTREVVYNSICADKFLNYIIPYLIEVLVTEGIYFIWDYPNHVMAQYLMDTVPDYLNWDVHARQQARALGDSRVEEEVQALINAASTAAMQNCNQRIDREHNNVQDGRKTAELMSTIQRQYHEHSTNIQQLLDHYQQQQQQQQQQQHHGAP